LGVFLDKASTDFPTFSGCESRQAQNLAQKQNQPCYKITMEPQGRRSKSLLRTYAAPVVVGAVGLGMYLRKNTQVVPPTPQTNRQRYVEPFLDSVWTQIRLPFASLMMPPPSEKEKPNPSDIRAKIATARTTLERAVQNMYMQQQVELKVDRSLAYKNKLTIIAKSVKHVAEAFVTLCGYHREYNIYVFSWLHRHVQSYCAGKLGDDPQNAETCARTIQGALLRDLEPWQNPYTPMDNPGSAQKCLKLLRQFTAELNSPEILASLRHNSKYRQVEDRVSLGCKANMKSGPRPSAFHSWRNAVHPVQAIAESSYLIARASAKDEEVQISVKKLGVFLTDSIKLIDGFERIAAHAKLRARTIIALCIYAFDGFMEYMCNRSCQVTVVEHYSFPMMSRWSTQIPAACIERVSNQREYDDSTRWTVTYVGGKLARLINDGRPYPVLHSDRRVTQEDRAKVDASCRKLQAPTLGDFSNSCETILCKNTPFEEVADIVDQMRAALEAAPAVA